MPSRILRPSSACAIAHVTLCCLTAAGAAHAQNEPPPTVPSPSAAPSSGDAPHGDGSASESSAPSAPSDAPPPAASAEAPPPAPAGTEPASAPATAPGNFPPSSGVAGEVEEPETPPRLIAFGSNTRWSVAAPAGDLYKGASLGDLSGAMYQVEGTLDAVFLERLVLGFRVGLGIASLDDSVSRACEADRATSCSLMTLNYGVHGEFLILPRRAALSPWVGVALSNEILMLRESYGSMNYDAFFSGSAWDFSAGVDFRFGKKKGIAVGPFASFRTGKYTSVEAEDPDGVRRSADISDPAQHHWLMLGVRSRF